jgi:hypothetical protein
MFNQTKIQVVRAGLTLLPFLVIGFCIMVVFSTCTMSLSAIYAAQMNVYKVLPFALPFFV